MDPILLASTGGHGSTNLLGIKTPILQETHLSGFFLKFVKRSQAEFLQANLARQVRPVHSKIGKDFINQTGNQSSTAQFLANAQRSFALTNSRLNEVFDKSLVTLQALVSQSYNRLCRNVLPEAARYKFVDEFNLPVLAARKEVHRLLARLEWACEPIIGFGAK